MNPQDPTNTQQPLSTTQPQPQPYQPPIQPIAPSPTAPQPVMPNIVPSQSTIPGVAPSTLPQSFNTSNNGSSSGGKKKFIIGGAAITAVLLILFVFVGLPAMAIIQAKSRATDFMQAITAQDVTKALTFVQNGGDDEDKVFLEAASAKVKGDFSFKDGKRLEDKYYALFNLTGGEYKYARTEMINVSGKWYLDGFYYDTQELKLISGGSTSTADKPTANKTADELPTTPVATTSSGACLVDSDLNSLFPFNEAIGSDLYEGGRMYNVETYFFQPDSTTYQYKEITEESLQEIADFYGNNKTKQFTINLSGKVYENGTTDSGLALSNQRAQKIKDELVARGVSSSLIIIDAPQEASATYGDGSERNVDLIVTSPASCTGGNNGR